MTERHTPTRLCLGCNSSDRQDRMARFALVEGRLDWSQARRARGRGAYLHPRQSCFEGFLLRKPFLRSLRASVDRAERARLVAELPSPR